MPLHTHHPILVARPFHRLHHAVLRPRHHLQIRPRPPPPPQNAPPPQPLIGGANYSPSPHSRPPVARAANWDRSAPCEKVRAPSSHFPSRGGFPSIARSECPAPVCRRGTHLGSESRSRSRARAYAPRTHAPAAQNPFARGPGPA